MTVKVQMKNSQADSTSNNTEGGTDDTGETAIVDPNNPIGVSDDDNSDLNDPDFMDKLEGDFDDSDTTSDVKIESTKDSKTEKEPSKSDGDEELKDGDKVDETQDSKSTPDEGDVAESDSEDQVSSEVKSTVDRDAIAQVLARLKAQTPSSDSQQQPEERNVEQPKSHGVEQQPEQGSSENTEELTHEQQLAQIKGNARKELVDKFKLSEDQVEAFREDPNEVLPQILADLYLDTYTSILTGLNQNLPTQVSKVVSEARVAQEAEQQFYTVWPQLNTDAGKEVVERLSKNYFSVNKGISRLQAITEIGAQAWVAAKLPLDELQQQVSLIEDILTPRVQTKVPKQQRFRQPSSNKASSVRTQVVSTDPFDQFVEEVIEEDDF